MNNNQMVNVRKIALEEFNKIKLFENNSIAWHIWKKAYDSAATNLPKFFKDLNNKKNE